MGFFDDEKRLALMQKLWRDGHSAGDIAERMNTTRNTVLGKLNRMGMLGARKAPKIRKPHGDAWRERPKDKAPKKRPTKVIEQIFETLPLPEEDPEDIALTTVIDREPNQCSWVVGEPVDMKMCGAPVVPGLSSPFCARHARRAFCPPEPTRRVLAATAEEKSRVLELVEAK